MIDIVVLATADWDHPLWTNKQHVTVSLVDEGCRVLYLESLGLRPAHATGRDVKRIVQRLWRGLRPPRRVRRNLWVGRAPPEEAAQVLEQGAGEASLQPLRPPLPTRAVTP